jgi:hypothetical protein
MVVLLSKGVERLRRSGSFPGKMKDKRGKMKEERGKMC